MNKTILVTGAAGYIGSHTCIELLKNNYSVIGLDSFANSRMATVYKMELISGHAIQFVRSNCMDQDLPSSIDGVIHFAAYKSVGDSVKSPGKYFENNNGSLNAVLDHARTIGAPLVFSSSACVYGNRYVGALHESLPKDPINPYGMTKSFGEDMLAAYTTAYGLPSVSLRYFNPIGSHPSGLIGDTTVTNLMPYILKVATKEEATLKIFGNDYDTADGTAIRDYIHVTDVAKAHIKALNYLLTEKESLPPINIGNGKGYSVLQIVKAFEEATQIEIPYEFHPRRAGDAASLVASNSSYKDLFGNTSTESLSSMCTSALNFKLKTMKESL